MTFHEKSAVTMTTLLAVVFGGYFVLVLGVVAHSPGREPAYTALALLASAVLAILAEITDGIIKVVLYRRGT